MLHDAWLHPALVGFAFIAGVLLSGMFAVLYVRARYESRGVTWSSASVRAALEVVDLNPAAGIVHVSRRTGAFDLARGGTFGSTGLPAAATIGRTPEELGVEGEQAAAYAAAAGGEASVVVTNTGNAFAERRAFACAVAPTPTGYGVVFVDITDAIVSARLQRIHDALSQTGLREVGDA